MEREDAAASTCIICGEETQDGIRICEELICVSCEAEILQTDVKDAKYPYFIHRMRQIWYRKDA